MPGPAQTVDQNILPVQAYFNLDGSFNTFIGQGQPFVISATESISITNSTVNATLYPTFTSSTGGQITGLGITSSSLTWNPSTGVFSAPTFYGTLNGTSNTANSIANGAQGQLVYQSAPGVSAFVPVGTTGQFLLSNGTSAPSWATVATSVTIADQTTDTATYYPLFYSATSGSTNTVETSSTKLQYVPSTGKFTATLFSGSGASLTNIPNGALTNSSVTIGSTSIALGGTSTTLSGLTSVTATTFTGSLVGNASTATTATNATNSAITDNTSSSGTFYPTLVTTTSGNQPLNTSSTKLSFQPSTSTLTASIFNGAATNIYGGTTNQIPVQSAANTTTFITAPSVSGTVLYWSGSAFSWNNIGSGVMVYPAAGIPNSTGTAWTTSYSTTGSGSVVALATSPVFVTPTLGVATATSLAATTATITNDASISGLTLGLGSGSVVGNTAFGSLAVNLNTTGSSNTGIGYRALRQNTTGSNNTAVGYVALTALQSGSGNSAFGLQSIQAMTSGSNNSGFGANSLYSLTTGSNNLAIGSNALFSSTNATNNTAVGYQSAYFNTTASNLTAYGLQSLYNNTTNVATLGTVTGGSGYTNGTYTAVAMTPVSGATFATYPTVTVVVSGGAVSTVTLVTNGVGATSTAATVLTVAASLLGGTGSGFSIPVATFASGTGNVAVGYQAAYSNTTGTNNTATGYQVLNANTTGTNNTAIGYQSLNSNTTASQNTAVGYQSGFNNTTGTYLTAMGYLSLYSNTTGNFNTAIGRSALTTNSTGSYNTSIGVESLLNNSTASNNTAVGYQSLYSVTGANNIGIGYRAGQTGTNNLTTGSNNLLIGYQAQASAATVSNEITIGNSSNTVIRYPHNYSTVANLPSASTVGQGSRTFVTDALAPVFQATVTGGGAVFTPVFSDGTNWKVG